MKKKITALLLVVVMLLASLSLFSCGDTKTSKSSSSYIRVTVDVGADEKIAQIEMMVTKSGDVETVAALNENGRVITVGEEIVGLSIEDAFALLLEISRQTGFLHKAENQDYNVIGLAVTDEYDENLFSKTAEDMYSALQKQATEFFTEHEIEGQVKKGYPIAEQQLKTLVASLSTYNDEQLMELGISELYIILAEGRAETANLPNDEMRIAYFAAKENELMSTKSAMILDIISDMDGLRPILVKAYEDAIATHSRALAELNAVVDSQQTGEVLTNAIAKASLASEALFELEDSIIDDEAKELIAEQQDVIDEALEELGLAFALEFEATYEAHIAAINESLLAKKAELKEIIAEEEAEEDDSEGDEGELEE